jgi:uncharacterized OB-fold protein
MAEFERARDGPYDDLLDAIETGDGYYLECEHGHGWLPPRRICPECGSRELTEEPLPESADVASYTEIAVAAPSWADDAPYVTAIADFGPVRMTGLLRNAEDPEIGMAVGVEVDERVTTGDRAIVFRPR